MATHLQLKVEARLKEAKAAARRVSRSTDLGRLEAMRHLSAIAELEWVLEQIKNEDYHH